MLKAIRDSIPSRAEAEDIIVAGMIVAQGRLSSLGVPPAD